MRLRNLQGWNAIEAWLQAKRSTKDWPWILAITMTTVIILLMLSTALHTL
jgi:hypothetical protein